MLGTDANASISSRERDGFEVRIPLASVELTAAPRAEIQSFVATESSLPVTKRTDENRAPDKRDRKFHPLAVSVVGIVRDSGDDRANRRG